MDSCATASMLANHTHACSHAQPASAAAMRTALFYSQSLLCSSMIRWNAARSAACVYVYFLKVCCLVFLLYFNFGEQVPILVQRAFDRLPVYISIRQMRVSVGAAHVKDRDTCAGCFATFHIALFNTLRARKRGVHGECFVTVTRTPPAASLASARTIVSRFRHRLGEF